MVVLGFNSTDNMMIKNKPKKVVKVMHEANEMEIQVADNTVAIKLIQHDIKTIKNNHLAHIEADLRKIDKKVEKIDLRLWGIMMLIVASAVANYMI